MARHDPSTRNRASSWSADLLSKAGRPLRLAAFGILLFAVAGGALAFSAWQSEVGGTVAEAELRARGAAADVDRYVQSRWWTLQAIAAAPVVSSNDLEAMGDYFTHLDPASIGFDAGISWIDRDGWMRVRSGDYRGPPIDFRDRQHVREALGTGRPSVSSAFMGAVNQVPIIAFAVPVFDEQGGVRGLIGAGVRLDAVVIGADSLRYAGGTDVMIVDRRGQLVVGSAPMTEIVRVHPDFPLDEVKQAGQGVASSMTGPNGDPDQLVGYAAAPTAEWIVLVQRPSAQAFAGATRAFVLQIVAIVLAAVVAIGLLLWAARRLERAVRSERATLEELQTAVAELQQRQAMSDAFIGVMSHELRTPVTTIYGAAKLLAREPRRDELESLVADIEAEADRLHRVTEDLLVLSRAEHGAVEIRPEPVLVQRIVEPVVADILRRFPGSTVRTEVQPDLPPISGDPGAVRQVLTNLLTNAAKYGDSSPILVRVAAEREAVRLVVEDAGPGVPSEELPRLFELYYRSPSATTRGSGTGIGLFVVRQLVEAMRGTVGAEPVVPRGIRFVVSLPVQDVTAEDRASPERREPRRRPVPAAEPAGADGAR